MNQYKLQEISGTVFAGMLKQLQNMWDIEEEENQSKTQQQLPHTITESTKHKLKLVKIGDEEQAVEHELDLDAYLETQRANTKGRVRAKPKTAEEVQKEKQFREGYGKGFKMLQKMGFNVNKGLGKNEQGRTNIIEAEFKTSLTTRDEDYEEQEEMRKRKQQRQEQEKEQINPYNENQFEQLFLYKSRSPVINNLLASLKNKYEINKGRLSILEKQCESFSRDLQISESLKVQKYHEAKEIDAEIEGLESIGRSTAGIERFPHLAITYNADLLIVREAIQKLEPVGLKEISPLLSSQIAKAKKTLNQLYLEKQKQSLKQFKQVTAFQERIQKHLQKQQNFLPDEDIISISEQDRLKIQKYLRLIVEETVIKNKLENYFSSLHSIEQCEDFVVDLMEIITECSKQLGGEIKQKYLLKLVNSYLRSWATGKGRKLPHLVVFPWLMVLHFDEIDIHSFFYAIMNKIWSIENDQLYNLITPWLKHIKNDHKAYFLHFYLAPRLLYEMENLNLSSPSSKDKVKGFLRYSELLPLELREQIIQNSLALTILHRYQKQLKEDPGQKADLKNWVIKWSAKFDNLCNGVIKKIFIENDITDIW